MASKKKEKKGKKGKVMDLATFLGSNQTQVVTVSKEVAEDDEEDTKQTFDRSVLPSAPRAARGPQYSEDDLPKQPPYKAYVGSLPYDITQERLERFFGAENIRDIHMVESEGRFKGYAYVEFITLDALKEALSKDGNEIQNRAVKVDLSNSTGRGRDGRDGDRRPAFGQSDGVSNWRDRPRDEPTRQPERRDWGSRGGGESDRRDWGNRGGGESRADTESSWRNASRDPPRTYERRDDRRDDRRGGYKRASPVMERKPLNLNPRTVKKDDTPAEQAAAGQSKTSIFGEAKPVDIEAKQREMERLAEERKPVKEEKPEKPKADIFGQARPVDLDKQRQMEELVEKNNDTNRSRNKHRTWKKAVITHYERRDRDDRRYERRDRDDDRFGRDRFSRDDRYDDRRRFERRDDYERRDDRSYERRDDRDRRGGYRDERRDDWRGADDRRDQERRDRFDRRGPDDRRDHDRRRDDHDRRDDRRSDEDRQHSPERREVRMVPAPPPTDNVWFRKPANGNPEARDNDTERAGDRLTDRPNDRQNDRADNRPSRPEADRSPARDKYEPPTNAWANKPKIGSKAPSSSSSGERRGGRGRGDSSRAGAQSKAKREKQLPQSIDEMPTLQAKENRDLADTNVFALLSDEDGDKDD